MSDETKNNIRLVLYVLFYPICGFFEMLKKCKGNDFSDFMDDWGYYLLFVTFWICGIVAVGLSVYGLTYHFVQTIIPISIISTAIFCTLGLPYIIHKIVNRK